MRTQKGEGSKTQRRHHLSVITILGLLACAAFAIQLPGRAGFSLSEKLPTAPRAALNTYNFSPLGSLAVHPPPLTPSVPMVATYAGDCSTPKSVFNVQDMDLTVCAKVADGMEGWQIIWSNANFIAVQTNTLATGAEDVTFTLTPMSNLGDWRVILYEPFGGSVYALTVFTVIDANNPTADLTLSTGSGTSTVAAGSQALFTVQITNLGPTDATDVEIVDSIPFNTTFSSFALASGPSGINCILPMAGASSGETTCTIPTLMRGETASFIATYDVLSGLAAGTTISNTATASLPASITDPNPDNNSSTATVRVEGAGAETCSLDCPANVVVTADTTVGGEFGAIVTFAAATVNGNCGSVTNNPASGSFFAVGTHSVVSTSELGGATCSFTVTVLDTAPPTIACPPNISVNLQSGQTEATGVDPGQPTINASGGGTVTGVRSDDDAGPNTPPKPLTDPYPIGTTGITWTVTDAGGRTASCTQTITVVAAGDRDPVTISCPSGVSVGAPEGSCETTIPAATIGTPTTNYPGDPDVVIESDRSDGASLADPFPAGTTIITWTATDNTNGNTASCTQIVTVTVAGDTTPPTLTVPPNVTVTTSTCGQIVGETDLGTATATDNNACGVVNIARTGVPPGNFFPTGTTTVIYTATDAAGNTSTGVQLVTVTESPAVPPTIACPTDIVVVLPLNSTDTSIVVNYSTPVGSDNCSGATTMQTAGLASGASFPVGTTTNTFKVTDAGGLTAECSFTVTVLYNFAGFFSPISNTSLNTVNAGRAIPVKFSLSGNKGLNILAANSPSSFQISCDGTAPTNEMETVTAGGSSLSYDAASDQYVYVWKTESSWAGTCRQLRVTLNDGSVHTANFRFR